MEGNRTNSNKLHFGIYNHVLTVDGDKLVTRKLIVLKDGNFRLLSRISTRLQEAQEPL